VDGVGGITTFSAVDSLRGYLGDDTFYGGDGGDRFFTERGNDTVYGGDGFDRVRYDRGGVESMDIDLAANIATGIWSGESFVDRLYDVESILAPTSLTRSAGPRLMSGWRDRAGRTSLTGASAAIC
jgi:hypothetical protein